MFTASSLFLRLFRFGALQNHCADLVHRERHEPRYGELEEGRETHPAPAVRFLAYGAQRCGARDVEQAEYHQAEGVELREAYGLELAGEGEHPLRRAGVDYAEEDGAARYDDFLC